MEKTMHTRSIQNCTSLDYVRFLRKKLGKVGHKNAPLFFKLQKMSFSFEALSDFKSRHWCTKSNLSVVYCPSIMIMKSPSVCPFV